MGLLAGYYGRWMDGVLMRVVDVMLAFPGILLALGIVAVLGTEPDQSDGRGRHFLDSHLCAA